MGIMDFLKGKRGKSTMTPMDILKERLNKGKEPECNCASCQVKNRALDELSADKIRLIYVAIEKYISRFDLKDKLGTTYNSSSPFKLPEGMTMQEAYKVISYISEFVEKTYNKEPASSDSVALTSYTLGSYGFEKIEGFPKGYTHSTEDYVGRGKVIEETTIPATRDLYTVGGDFGQFKKSNLYSKYFNWFVENVSLEEVQAIYDRIGLQLPNQQTKQTM